VSGTRYADALLNPKPAGSPMLTPWQRQHYAAQLSGMAGFGGIQPPDPNTVPISKALGAYHWPTTEEIKQGLSTLPDMLLASTTAPEAEGLATSFVSPNVGKLDFAGALRGMRSKRQQLLLDAAQDIHEKMGVEATHTPGIGAWSDGAEPTIMSTSTGMDPDQLDTSAAMLGSLANQKQVLTFHEDPNGSSFLHHFDAKGGLEDIHKNLLEDGVPFHTLIPTPTGATVYVADFGDDAGFGSTVSNAAARYGAKSKAYRGNVKLLGTSEEAATDAESRAKGVEEYARIIAGSGHRDSSVLWQELRDTHERALKETTE